MLFQHKKCFFFPENQIPLKGSASSAQSDIRQSRCTTDSVLILMFALLSKYYGKYKRIQFKSTTLQSREIAVVSRKSLYML